MIKSPCINICSMSNNGYCSGCHRTKDEIAKWIILSDYQKSLILEKIKNRKSNKNKLDS